MRLHYESRTQTLEQKSKESLRQISDLLLQNQRLLTDRKRLRIKLDMFSSPCNFDSSCSSHSRCHENLTHTESISDIADDDDEVV